MSQTRFLSHEPLTNDAIRVIAPAVFAEGKHASRSEKYTYIPTTAVLDGLAAEGFRPYEVAIQRTRKGIPGYGKHQVRLRHDSQLSAVGGIVSEVVYTNSHDGSSTSLLEVGLYITRCRNGLVASIGDLVGQIRVQHRGDVVAQVVGGAVEILSHLPEAHDQAQSWRGITLEPTERLAFAQQALALRFPKGAPFEAAKLLEVRRYEEVEPTLWNTFYVVQENTVRGGLSYLRRDDNGRLVGRRRTKQIQGIDQHGSINRALWKLAAGVAQNREQLVALSG